MPNYVRPRSSGATIFFTVCLADRRSDLLVREVGLLRDAVRKTRRERPFEIIAWVVLPDHLHCIWRLPVGDSDFSVRWGAIKSRFARSVRRVGIIPTLPRTASKIRKGDAGFWQRRFWEHHIRTQEELNALIRYCWFNPVKHRLVERPCDWPYSSFHRDVRLGRVPVEWQGRDIEIEAGERAGVQVAG